MTSCARNSSIRPCRRPSLLGLTIPDPDLRWNEDRGHYDFSEPDWSEFFAVIQGRWTVQFAERMDARRKAWDDGAWVREGLMAHAEKKRAARSRRNRRAVP
jgi:ring-1,2-phenylacetyl-CoA epoxidase subunit PaaA